MDNLELYNVSRVNDQYNFVSESTNYILDSSMKGVRLDRLCHIDCSKHDEIFGVSKLGNFSSCDNYNNWNDFNMKVELVANDDGYSISFTPQDNFAYAIAEITKGVDKNNTLSFNTTGNLHCQILREIKIDSERFAASIFAEPAGDTFISDSYTIFNFDSDTDIQSKYYLLITGTGTIDDIIIADKDTSLDHIHTKKISLLGFLPEIDNTPRKFINLTFDNAFNSFYQTEMDIDGKITTTSNIAYGLTKIFALNDSHQERIQFSQEIRQQLNCYRSENAEGILTISDIYLPYADSIEKIYVKVNDVMIDNFTNFTIQLNAAGIDKEYRKINVQRKTNLLETSISASYSYLQTDINLPPNKVINNVEVYALYGETNSNLYVHTYDEGSVTTKIYDVGFTANYSLSGLSGTAENVDKIDLFMRGLKEDTQNHEVFTEWYKCELNTDLNIVGNPHIFNSYRLFQFKLNFKSQDAAVKIDEFILKQN